MARGLVDQATIYARASGAGKAGVAVYRISGPGARKVSEALIGRTPPPRCADRVRVIDPERRAALDDGLAIFFEAPASFTGEDVLELQLHGSAAVEAALYQALSELGAAPAAPGAFTRRAFENGKLDLAQVEGLADLIDAETEGQRRQALGQLSGGMSTAASSWRDQLVRLLAAFEADIDFPDEDDAPSLALRETKSAIAALERDLAAWADSAARGALVRRGARVALIGAPNAGKSSLLNALAGDDRAMVSDIAGTTRDVVEARLDLSGLPVSVLDTAGLRDQPTDDLEREGARRAAQAAASADVRLLVVDVSRETNQPIGTGDGAPSFPADFMGFLRDGDMVVRNKIDLLTDADVPRETERRAGGIEMFSISAKTGDGVPSLIDALARRVAAMADVGDTPPLTRERHRIAVADAVVRLAAARERLETAGAASIELAAEDVRLAARRLASVAGAVDVEAVLGEIFSSFCIGK